MSRSEFQRLYSLLSLLSLSISGEIEFCAALVTKTPLNSDHLNEPLGFGKLKFMPNSVIMINKQRLLTILWHISTKLTRQCSP